MKGDLQFLPSMGFQFVREEGKPRRVAIDVEEHHRQANGVVHGSIIHGLLDTIMGVEVFRANDRKTCATSEISIRYLTPVFDGRPEAYANVIKVGKRLTTVEGRVLRGDDVVAVGQASFFILDKLYE